MRCKLIYVRHSQAEEAVTLTTSVVPLRPHLHARKYIQELPLLVEEPVGPSQKELEEVWKTMRRGAKDVSQLILQSLHT